MKEFVHRDPAISFLMLLPLALIHLSGYADANLEAVSWILKFLSITSPYSFYVLLGSLFILIFWSLGRIVNLGLPWRGSALTIFAEGFFWSVILGPFLGFLQEWLSDVTLPLSIMPFSGHTELAIAAGAGLYEEIIFRLILFGGLLLWFKSLFGIFWSDSLAQWLGVILAILISSFLFAYAHGWAGDESAHDFGPMLFRTLAGMAFSLIFLFRGIAVCAYAHFAYDAMLLLKS
jgi:membrane protease YdiL (CAAX protease family)